MTITVSKCCVRVDGVQQGPIYAHHATAVHEAEKLKNRRYPFASLIDLDTPSPKTETETKKEKVGAES